jgi:hypothetical protein
MHAMRTRRWLTVIAAGAALLGAGPAQAQTAAELHEQAKQAYAKRGQAAQAKLAFELYEKAIDAGAPFDALWEGARAAFFLGEFPMGNAAKGARLAVYEKGRTWAAKAATQRPTSAPAVFWHGTLVGSWAQTKGVLKSLNMSDEVRTAAEKSLKLDPNVECGGPYRLLGRYYFKLPGVFGGDTKRAVKLLEQGTKTCPGNDFGHLYLAEALHELARDAVARQEIDGILARTPDPRFAPERPYVVKRAKAFLAELE